mmetsp:Transcript_17511/g.42725  ORF Transcript_17511/g.42725 Transcript_17511/m.42725 type:complete len:243 (-) Transcript_17511:3086-3814(-)
MVHRRPDGAVPRGAQHGDLQPGAADPAVPPGDGQDGGDHGHRRQPQQEVCGRCREVGQGGHHRLRPPLPQAQAPPHRHRLPVKGVCVARILAGFEAAHGAGGGAGLGADDLDVGEGQVRGDDQDGRVAQQHHLPVLLLPHGQQPDLCHGQRGLQAAQAPRLEPQGAAQRAEQARAAELPLPHVALGRARGVGHRHRGPASRRLPGAQGLHPKAPLGLKLHRGHRGLLKGYRDRERRRQHRDL